MTRGGRGNAPGGECAGTIRWLELDGRNPRARDRLHSWSARGCVRAGRRAGVRGAARRTRRSRSPGGCALGTGRHGRPGVSGTLARSRRDSIRRASPRRNPTDRRTQIRDRIDHRLDRSYGRNPYPGCDDIDSRPFLFDGDTDERLVAKERVVGIRHNGEALAVVTEALMSEGVIEAAASGSGGAETAFRDRETGSSWTIFGKATAGPLARARRSCPSSTTTLSGSSGQPSNRTRRSRVDRRRFGVGFAQ